jgi:hypothetical protein
MAAEAKVHASFSMFNDLRRFVRIDENIPKSIMRKVAEHFADGKEADPTGIFYHKERVYDQQGVTRLLDDPDEIMRIAARLFRDGYYVLNRVNKYYVVAFALDWVRFEIYSKDCPKEVVKWRKNDGDDPIVARAPADYDVNPVLRFMQSLG